MKILYLFIFLMQVFTMGGCSADETGHRDSYDVVSCKVVRPITAIDVEVVGGERFLFRESPGVFLRRKASGGEFAFLFDRYEIDTELEKVTVTFYKHSTGNSRAFVFDMENDCREKVEQWIQWSISAKE